MARAPRSRVMLTIKVQFEPNRLSEQCLMTAYELALPLRAEAVGSKKTVPTLMKSHDPQNRKAGNNG
jgi:hypothetical protein